MKTCVSILLCLLVPFSVGCNNKKDQTPAASNTATGPMRATVDTVGTKGKDTGGYLSTVVAQRYRAQDRLDLMMVDYNLKIYQANTGELPADMDEFRRELVDNRDYAVKLPELEPGLHYEYDPKDGPVGTLWVVPDEETDGDTSQAGDGQ